MTLRGEGGACGTANIFIRFSFCNLACDGSDLYGVPTPVCDTDFENGRSLTLHELLTEIELIFTECCWVILTGGEPALQIDATLIDALHAAAYKIAIETNGTN